MMPILFQKNLNVFKNSFSIRNSHKISFSSRKFANLNTTSSQPHVVVGLSGGVDSSVSAYLLKQKGYKTTAVYMQNWNEEETGNYCTSKYDWEDVQAVCEMLDIPLKRVNFSSEYWNSVFSHFLEGLEKGRTPNPDVLCNKEIKFKLMYQYAIDKLGADYVATGHYAQIKIGENGEPLLQRSVDKRKDQTYFLAAIPSNVLKKVLFPVGHLIKPEVRRIADSLKLPTAKKKDSTGLCFVGKRNFKEFISDYIDKKEGGSVYMIDDSKTEGSNPKPLKKLNYLHEGVHFYTIGQRAAIPGHTSKLFVYKKDAESNSIFVCEGTQHPALFCDSLIANEISWISTFPPKELIENNSMEVNFKVRYNFLEHDSMGTISYVDQNKQNIKVQFKEPIRAVAEGQYIVFYKDDICLGSGVIVSRGESFYDQSRDLVLKEGVHFNQSKESFTYNWY